jgi:hypothetical protein
MQLTSHFKVEEFVPREIYNQYGDKSIWFIDSKIVTICDWLRVNLNRPITINDWHTGGQYNYSGYRPPDCAIGAKLSQHKRGAAADIKVRDMTPVQVAAFIKANYKELFKLGLTTIEKDTPSWTHIDTRWTGSPYLFEVPFQ